MLSAEVIQMPPRPPAPPAPTTPASDEVDRYQEVDASVGMMVTDCNEDLAHIDENWAGKLAGVQEKLRVLRVRMDKQRPILKATYKKWKAQNDLTSPHHSKAKAWGKEALLLGAAIAEVMLLADVFTFLELPDWQAALLALGFGAFMVVTVKVIAAKAVGVFNQEEK